MQLNGAKVFAHLDLNKQYHEFELEENCRYITTFSTDVGLFRYKWFHFVVSSAAEIFQDVISRIIQPVTNAFNYSDDILVFAAMQKEHDKALTQVCQLFADAVINLNAFKLFFKR